MITSPSNGKIKQVIKWQGQAKKRKEDDIYLVEGIKMFEEAPVPSILEAYISETCFSKIQNTSVEEKLNQIRFEIVSDDLFKRISDTQTPQGILVILKRVKYELEELLKIENPLFILLEDLQDPGNLGTIVRTGEGAGVSAIFMTKNTVDIYNPKTIRATMGSIYRVPHLYIEEIEEVVESLHNMKIATYAAHLEGSTDFQKTNFQKGTAFFVGNEGKGLKKHTADLAKSYIKIPMLGKVESLNAGVATSLLMYEVYRQRNS